MRRVGNRTTALGLSLVVLSLVIGCGGKKESNRSSTMTEAQRDSLIGESPLPGSNVMKGALAVSDSARARADRLNAAGDAP